VAGEETSAEAAPEAAPDAAEDGSYLSTWDCVLLTALLGAVLYYYFFSSSDAPADFQPTDIHISSSPVVRTERSDDASFIGQMRKSGSKVVVFYGSQTGTAEEFASRIAKEFSKYGLKSIIADPEECDMSDLSALPSSIPEHLVVLCMATYGEGDPTDNAAEFYQMLQDQEMDLEGLRYCVFALGNKTYEQYNETGRYVNKRLAELRAERVFPIGEGDDDANMEDDFITWKDELVPKVCELFGLEEAGEEVSMRQYELTEPEDVDPDRLFQGEIGRLKTHLPEKQRPPFDVKNPYMAAVLVNRELHTDSGRNCLHIEVDIKDSRIRYEAGDHVAVFPSNKAALVERLCSLLSKAPDTVFSLTNPEAYASKKSPFPCPTTYRTALTHYVDICAPPRTHVLKEFLRHTTGEEDRARLSLMTGKGEAGKAAYHAWVVEACRSVVAVLEDLPTCRPPLDLVCEMLPRLQARYYSISSSSRTHPTSIHITAVVLRYGTPTGRTHDGVATTWLMDRRPGDKLPIFVRRSQFRLPVKSQVPVVMIGPGTGLAPFRGFLQERGAARGRGDTTGQTLLYFGCRHKDKDYIYRDELEAWRDEGLITLRTAFSRDQESKVYVQHLLAEDAETIWDIIGKQKGHIYVCGDAKNMAREVHAEIVAAVRTCGDKSAQEAEDYVKTMVAKRRYCSDVWS